jgi:hypothetical protein
VASILPVSRRNSKKSFREPAKIVKKNQYHTVTQLLLSSGAYKPVTTYIWSSAIAYALVVTIPTLYYQFILQMYYPGSF